MNATDLLTSANIPCVSERKAVERERKAFLDGVSWSLPPGLYEHSRASGAADSLYPLPKVTCPRRVRDADGYTWKYENGELAFADPLRGIWYSAAGSSFEPTPDRVRLLADLLVNPTEEVEA